MQGLSPPTQLVRHALDFVLHVDQHLAGYRGTSRVHREFFQLVFESATLDDEFLIREQSVVDVRIRASATGSGRCAPFGMSGCVPMA